MCLAPGCMMALVGEGTTNHDVRATRKTVGGFDEDFVRDVESVRAAAQ